MDTLLDKIFMTMSDEPLFFLLSMSLFFLLSMSLLFFLLNFFDKVLPRISDKLGSAAERMRDSDVDQLIVLRKKIERESSQEVAEKLKTEAEKFESRLRATKRTSLWSEDGSLDVDWRHVLAVTRERLILETERLQSRSRANLSYAILMSFCGLFFIGVIVFIFPLNADNRSFDALLLDYVPRVTFIVIIQIVSAFFFRMYVSNESDIKQNKNEITNIECRLAAGLMVGHDKDGLTVIADVLAKEERNFILKKGEKVAGEAWRTGITDLKMSVDELAKKLGKSEAGR